MILSHNLYNFTLLFIAEGSFIVNAYPRISFANQTEEDDFHEKLIIAVEKRKALYHPEIPVKEKHPVKIKDLWEEVCDELFVPKSKMFQVDGIVYEIDFIRHIKLLKPANLVDLEQLSHLLVDLNFMI